MPASAPLFAGALFALAAAAPTAGELLPAFPDTSDRRLIVDWLVKTAGFPAGAPSDIGVDSAVVVVTDSTDGLGAGLHNVTYREEAISVEAVGRNGGRSVSGSGGVDCNEGLFRMGGMTVFHGTGGKGERVVSFPAQTAWREPATGTLFERVVESVCDAPDAAGPTSVAATPPAAPPPPAPDAPIATSQAAGLRGGPVGRVTIQVGAFATREQANAGLTKAAAMAAGALRGHATEVAAASVNGSQVYRALVHGFSTRLEAQAVCARLQSQGQPCLVRP